MATLTPIINEYLQQTFSRFNITDATLQEEFTKAYENSTITSIIDGLPGRPSTVPGASVLALYEGGISNKADAQAFAKANNGYTISDTGIGKYLTNQVASQFPDVVDQINADLVAKGMRELTNDQVYALEDPLWTHL
jgi:hypothetical protein